MYEVTCALLASRAHVFLLDASFSSTPRRRALDIAALRAYILQ
jgi:hypothetical protein